MRLIHIHIYLEIKEELMNNKEELKKQVNK